jgi:hypothetical protein
MLDEYYKESYELRQQIQTLISRYPFNIGHIIVDKIYCAKIIGDKPKRTPVLELSGINNMWLKHILSQGEGNYFYGLAVWETAWDEMYLTKKEWLLFDSLLSISPQMDGTLRKKDVYEWGCMIAIGGCYWRQSGELPLLSSGPIINFPIPQRIELEENE